MLLLDFCYSALIRSKLSGEGVASTVVRIVSAGTRANPDPQVLCLPTALLQQNMLCCA